MRKLIAQPATVIIGDHVHEVVEQAWLSDQHGTPLSVEAGTSFFHIVDIAETKLDSPGLFTGVTAPSGFPITVRTVEQDDTVGQAGFPAFPLPVPVIGAILSGQNMDTHVEALVGDDGFVVTLLLVTDVGLWTRFSSQWLRLYDVTPISNLNSVDVEDTAVDLFDAADNSGNVLPISSYPGAEKTTGLPVYQESGTMIVSPTAQMTFTPESVTGGGGMLVIPLLINTAEDLPAAIQAAANDESLRWYVERRARALAPDTVLPWQE